MVRVTDHDISELEDSLFDVRIVRRICADPEAVEVIATPDETAVIARFNIGMSSANPQTTNAFLDALRADPERITHISWREFTHRRSCVKQTVYMTHTTLDTLSDIAEAHESSIEHAIEWLCGRYASEMDEGAG